MNDNKGQSMTYFLGTACRNRPLCQLDLGVLGCRAQVQKIGIRWAEEGKKELRKDDVNKLRAESRDSVWMCCSRAQPRRETTEQK
jgi:hypothetical protein